MRVPFVAAVAVLGLSLVGVAMLSFVMFYAVPKEEKQDVGVVLDAYTSVIRLERLVQQRVDDVRWSERDFGLGLSQFEQFMEKLNATTSLRFDGNRLRADVASGDLGRLSAALDRLVVLERDLYASGATLKAANEAVEARERAHSLRVIRLSLWLLLVYGAGAALLAYYAVCHRGELRALSASYARLDAVSRELRDSSARALEAKNAFLAMVSHELRSPLQTLLSSIQLLEKPGADFARILPRLRRGSVALDRQLEDLMALAKADRVTFDVGPFVPEVLIERACSNHSSAAKAKGLRLVRASEPQNWVVSACGARVTQVLDNLVSNAVRYTASGTVGVFCDRLESSSKMLTFRVRDTGYGIRAEDLPRIFLPFTRFHTQYDSPEASRGHRKGGVGLAIVKALVDGMGGSIEVRTEVGKGTEFVVHIPCAVIQNDFPLARDQLSVLVVDDEPDILAAVAEVLGAEGVAVEQAAGRRDGYRLWLSAQPTLVLTDVDLQDGTGDELVLNIRDACGRDRDLRAPVVVGMSAAGVQGTLAGGVFDGFLTKPIATSQLVDLISSLTYDARSR